MTFALTSPFALIFVLAGSALRKHGISGALIAGGHGTTGKQADMAAVLAP